MIYARLRRRSVIGAGIAATSFALGTGAVRARPEERDKGEVDAKEVGAVEDLMREHGVLRRCFLLYRECAGRLRINPAGVDAAAINDTARLFRSFGEDYHETKLEEAHIFPKVKREFPAAAALVDTLIAQHARGREITDYILSATAGARIAGQDAELLARAFDRFEIMYANHTAREDTIVFPDWKKRLSSEELAEMGDKFEDIEREEFGGDGFDDAVTRIATNEKALGLTNLAQFTAPRPPDAHTGQ
jgi:hemerythrin-like domain-containing protein